METEVEKLTSDKRLGHGKKLFFLTLLFQLAFCAFTKAQKDDVNVITFRGENFKEETTVSLNCVDNCVVIDKENGYIAFTLTGKIGERTIVVSAETPVMKGTKKIKVDKDGDMALHQKLTIEIFGSNPAVDKDSYEIQDESDEALITIQSFNESKGEIAGNFIVKYIDSATGIKRLSASCRFLIGRK